ncbi:MAG: pyruvate/2-oxoglutarate dehydrogenase complex dihydrolipoamide dehydrogenase (E3) component [Acidimicrobiales bacterium]|jgi:pyruvate/2-oxoglutarate dehydrogenase complex dihydrolipoamide dehydrogenase (E3) component/uncharacterized membrane protein YdjX (TVP38/TMEM64 family)
MKQSLYDIVVIGAGSGGLTTAVGFSKVGKKVLLVEREHIGGECTNSGCIPSKALLHHAKSYHAAKQISGQSKEGETYRTEAFNYVRDKVNSILEEETPETFEKLGIDVVMGEAVFHTKCSIKVNGTTYGYKKAIIATGSSPQMIKVEGLKTSDVLSNQNIFELDDVPKKLLIIGSGPIGMEMGQAFAMLGSKVTIASIDSRFARLEDDSISPIIQAEFEKLGIDIHLNAFIQKVESDEAVFELKENDEVTGEVTVPFDKVLIAIGRVPNLPEGLEIAGIKSESYGIVVDKQHRTSNKHVYAVGDVAQKLKFTHTADDIGRQVVMHVLSKGWVRLNTKKAVPKVTYTKPEMAQVGLSHTAALEKYSAQEIMRIEVPYTANHRANTDNETDGLMIVIARRLNGAVLGAHIIGVSSGEMISVFTLAIDRKISMWQLRRIIFAYPTYCLLIKKAGDYFFAQQIASLKNDLLYQFKKHAPKIIALIFWGTILYTFQQYRIDNNLSYQAILLQGLHFFTSTMYGPLVYMGLYAIRPIILFPATLLTALSGALFGFWWGIAYTILGENASANFAYWIGRFFGKDLRLEDSLIGNWVEALRKNGFGTVLLMRLFYVPFDLTNYGSGIVKVKWSKYALATVIGIMPGLTTFVALGAAVDIEEFQMNGLTFDALDPKFLALSATIFIVSLLLSKFLKYWRAKL